jgi:hypothetical protein
MEIRTSVHIHTRYENDRCIWKNQVDRSHLQTEVIASRLPRFHEHLLKLALEIKGQSPNLVPRTRDVDRNRNACFRCASRHRTTLHLISKPIGAVQPT